MGEHPAARILAAARLLRDQAQAAKDATGDGHGGWSPWGTVKNTRWVEFPEPREVPAAPYPFGDGGTERAAGQYEPTGGAFVAHSRWAHDDEEDWYEPAFFAGPMPEALAAYIAGMHPQLGLALAGILDRAAKDAGEYLSCDVPEGEPEWFCGLCDGMLFRDCHFDPVLELVRIIIGEEQEQ